MRRPERKFLAMRAADHRHILLASLLFLFWRGCLGEDENGVGCHKCRPAVPRSSREGEPDDKPLAAMKRNILAVILVGDDDVGWCALRFRWNPHDQRHHGAEQP